MKRLFISLLVLAMASTAGADLRIMVDGDKNPTDLEHISPTGNFTLGIWTDEDIYPPLPGMGEFALVVDTSYGTIDYTSGIVAPPYNIDPFISLENSMSAVTAGYPLPMGEDGISGGIFMSIFDWIDTDSIIFDDINFHSSWPLTVAINLYVTYYDAYGVSTSILDDSVVVIAPEPTTIGLLALGALFLRRRK